MTSSLFNTEIDGLTVRFTVRPLPLYTAFERIRFVVAGLIAAALFIGISNKSVGLAVVVVGLTLAVAYWLQSGKVSVAKRGRRLTRFTVSPSGITLDDGTTLSKSDIERMYITAPAAGETVVHTGIGSGGVYTGVSSTGGVGSGLAARSWQVVVQARGVEHWLGGGLTQPMARSLSTQVQRALQD